MSFLSRISLANRSLVALATIAILIIGGLVIPSLEQELYPSLEFPSVTVVTVYPGASPSIVEKDVTDPCNGYLGHPFKNMRFENDNDLPPLLANKGR